MAFPAVLSLKSIWHDVSPQIGQRLFDRLRAAPGGAILLMYLDARVATRDEANATRSGIGHVGLYFDPHWYPGDGAHWDLNGAPLPDPVAFRKTVTSTILALLAIGDPVMFDFEKVPVSWLRQFLWGRGDGSAGYRGTGGTFTGGSNPDRPTAWTDASYQAGNWSAAISDLVRAGFVLFVQLYYGGMQPVEEPVWAMFEPVYYGYPARAVRPFYDAARYPPGWNTSLGGCLFTTNRLPFLFSRPMRPLVRARRWASDRRRRAAR